MKVVSLFLFLSSLLFAFDMTKVELSSSSVANGKSLLIEFFAQESIEYRSVEYANRSFEITQHPLNKSSKYAIIPFEYYEKPEDKTLEIKYIEGSQERSQTLLIKVVAGTYEKEELRVSSEKVNPQGKALQKRIAEEYHEAMRIYADVTEKNYINSPFILPIESEITSDFGRARTYNGTLKGYHGGTDFRAKVGTPIVAANDGIVALVKDRFYSGGTVLLNHGSGVYTCYFHMSSFSVKEGDEVKKGELLGLSGESGRVTGAHLHFSARINAVQVDPLQLITLINQNLLKGKK